MTKGYISMEDILQVGVIASPHGLKGEVRVFPTTDDVRRFKRLKDVLLEMGEKKITLEIEDVKFSGQFVLLKFKGLDSIGDVEKYRGKGLYVTRDKAVRLRRDEYFIADLIGLSVRTEDGGTLGTLTNVISTGANDVYAVKMEGDREVLIPAIKECILDVDIEGGLMTVHLLDGLLE